MSNVDEDSASSPARRFRPHCHQGLGCWPRSPQPRVVHAQNPSRSCGCGARLGRAETQAGCLLVARAGLVVGLPRRSRARCRPAGPCHPVRFRRPAATRLPTPFHAARSPTVFPNIARYAAAVVRTTPIIIRISRNRFAYPRMLLLPSSAAARPPAAPSALLPLGFRFFEKALILAVSITGMHS